MSFSQVKIFRQAGHLDKAFEMAQTDLLQNPADIWNKRSMAWVLVEFIKQTSSIDQFEAFTDNVNKLSALGLPESESMIFDNVAWQFVKMGFNALKSTPVDITMVGRLFEITRQLSISKPSDPYSVIFKVFYKVHHEWPGFTEFVKWWNLENFRSEDFLKEKLPDGKEIISLAERGYIGYAKCLLDSLHRTDPDNHESVVSSLREFLPNLDKLIDKHPEYVYPPYFKAKILLALGDKDNVLSAFLPFARSKSTEFWVWDLLSDIFRQDEEKQLACLCKALTCKTPEDFLVKVRFKLAEILVQRKCFPEAKTEILDIVKTRQANNWPIPPKVSRWVNSAWFADAKSTSDNQKLYREYLTQAEDILFHDIPEEIAVVEFVNKDKKILNFVISRQKTGFFKYANYLKKVDAGDRVMVRLSGNEIDSQYRVLTLKTTNQPAPSDVYKEFEGSIRIKPNQPFGFVNDIFIDPDFVKMHNLSDNQMIKGHALISFNKKRNEWGWKCTQIEMP